MRARIPFVRIFSLAAFAGLLVGCSDMGLLRAMRRSPKYDAPQPAPTLHIPDPPRTEIAKADSQVQQAANVAPAAKSDLQAKGVASPSDNPLRILHQKAVQRFATMDTYIMRMKRREAINGKLQPEEVMLAKFRQQPQSVYLKWIGGEGKGREVVYVKGRFNNEIHTKLALGDVPFMPAGTRFSVGADSMLVKNKSRYPISEAGVGCLIDRFGVLVAAAERNDPSQGTVKHLGQVKRPEFEQPVELVHHVLPPKCDPLMPTGGQRWWHFDPMSGLPVLLIAHEGDREVEYYCHDRFVIPANLDDDDFTPDVLWKR
jgi:hypothetical protein